MRCLASTSIRPRTATRLRAGALIAAPQPLVADLFKQAKRYRISDYALAARTGYSVSAISGARRGEHSPKIAFVVDLAMALGLRLEFVPYGKEPSRHTGR